MDSHITSLALALDKHDVTRSFHDVDADETIRCQFGVPSHSSADSAKDNEISLCSNAVDKVNLEDYDDSYEKLTNETAQIFAHLSSKDSSVRQVGLNIVSQSVYQWLSIFHTCPHQQNEGSILEYGSTKTNDNYNSEVNALAKHDVSAKIVKQTLASLLRLSIRCPFPDVRETCHMILMDLQERNVKIPMLIHKEVSRFIPDNQINPADAEDEQAFSLYEESFVHNCRLEHMVMIMGLHPQYLQQFLNTNFHLLQSQGALSYECRSYIGIMAAARHRCPYLVHLMEAHFLLQGGDRKWLKGVHFAPAKLRALSVLNKLLAHRPWLVTPSHIKELVEGVGQSGMTVPELAQAIVLMCHFHGVAIFCHGTGANLEIDHENAHMFHSAQPSDNSNQASRQSSGSSTPVTGDEFIERSGDIELLMECMKKLREEEEDVTREELARRFEKEKEEASLGIMPNQASSSNTDTSNLSRYVIDPNFSYQDFAKRDGAAEVPTFKAMDYNWNDNACLVVRKYCSEVADMLDDKFDLACNLTYKTLASKDNVDTSSLRAAIWMYVHCMYGVMYDDYNYGEVNQLLERPLKVFIKTVSCFPEKTTRNIYDAFWKQFRHSEKVHVNIMLMEARVQVELMYGMRAISEYLRDN